MATADTFQGVAAFITCNDTTLAGIYTQLTIDLVVVDAYTTPALANTITVPLPSGCSNFYDAGVSWADDGALYVAVRATSSSTLADAEATPNTMKAQLHKYVVTDAGAYTLVWHGTETGFMGSPFAVPPQFPGGEPVVTRDGSWGYWDAPFDAGTGVVTWPATSNYTDVDAGLTYLAFPDPGYLYYPGSGFTNCLHRLATSNTFTDVYHDAITFDGTIVKSAHWPVPDISSVVSGDTSNWENFGFGFFHFYRDALMDAFATWYNIGEDAFYFQTSQVDLDTYVPLTWSPLYNGGREILAPDMDIFPGLGISSSPASTQLLMLKRGTSGYYVPYNTSPNVHPGIDAAFRNGLTASFTIDSGNAPHYLHQAGLGWIDSTGAATSIATVALSNEPRVGTWAFRPVLPTDTLTGYIDTTRRLFTAV